MAEPKPAQAHRTEMDPKLFREAMGCFATGVAVVTTKDQDELHGMTVNSLTSVSLRPTLLLVCLAQDSRTAAAVHSRGWFVVNILDEGQAEMSRRFARPGDDHNGNPKVVINEFDLPEIPGSLSHLVCRVENVRAAGDHFIVVGEVVKAHRSCSAPLVFFRGRYHTLGASGERADLDWYW